MSVAHGPPHFWSAGDRDAKDVNFISIRYLVRDHLINSLDRSVTEAGRLIYVQLIASCR